jgi:hypothetical protein
MEMIDSQNGRTGNNKPNTAGRPGPTRFRFIDRMIEGDQDNKPIAWGCYMGEEVGLLTGYCVLIDDTLCLSSWKVRQPLEEWNQATPEKFEKYLASLPEWNRTRRVVTRNSLYPDVLYERKSDASRPATRKRTRINYGNTTWRPA